MTSKIWHPQECRRILSTIIKAFVSNTGHSKAYTNLLIVK